MRSKYILIYFILFLFDVHSQNNNIDSLRKALINANDTSRINILLTIGRQHFHGDPDSALIYIKEAAESAQDLDYKRGLKEVNVCYSVYYFLKNNFDRSIEFAQKVLAIKGADYAVGFDGDAYTLMANGYLRKNMPDKALNCYHLAIAVYEKLKNEGKIAMVENNIGNIFYEQNRYKEASTYYLRSIEKRTRLGVEKELITPYNNLGNAFNSMRDYKKALEYQEKALQLSLKTNSIFNIASCYQDIGAIYFSMDDLKRSLEYKQKALNIFRNTDYLVETTSCYLGVGEIYTEEKNYKIALMYIDSARVIADSTGFTFNRHLVYKNLSTVYKLMGNFKDALEYSEMTAAFQDSLVNENSNKTITEMQTKYESEKKDTEILIQKAEAEKQHAQRNGSIAGLILLLFLLIFILRGYRQKQKANTIISEQKEMIEEKNKNMLDSINYARHIQQALLSSEQLFIEHLKNYFILYNPKDIVSGDFYWTCQKEDSFYVAVCDSTGHGVPGAFMSLLNASFLNEALNEKNLRAPNEIFNYVRNKLTQSLSTQNAQDGMDAVLLRITGKEITYCSAQNSSVYIQNGMITKLHSDKMPVGKGQKNDSFTLQKLNVKQNDTIYLYTDGFADQFGGPKGKKFKYKALNELLTSISNLPLLEQKEKLDSTFEDWKGNLEQVDDVCIIGIKL